MTVKYAEPVLSETTANIIWTFCTSKTSKTEKYCQMLDNFLDSPNVTNLEEH